LVTALSLMTLLTKLEVLQAQGVADSFRDTEILDCPLLGMECQADEEVAFELASYADETHDCILFIFDKSIDDLAVEFAGCLPPDELQTELKNMGHGCYVINRFKHTNAGKETSADLLFLYCPESATPTDRVRLASVRLNLLRAILDANILMPHAIFYESIEDVTVANTLEQLYPKKPVVKNHAKPLRKDKVRKGSKQAARKFVPLE